MDNLEEALTEGPLPGRSWSIWVQDSPEPEPEPEPQPQPQLQDSCDLHDAACSGDVAAIEQSLAGGTAVDALDRSGMTALHWASKNGHTQAVECLLECGADA